jgi:hypothetical protein
VSFPAIVLFNFQSRNVLGYAFLASPLIHRYLMICH